MLEEMAGVVEARKVVCIEPLKTLFLLHNMNRQLVFRGPTCASTRPNQKCLPLATSGFQGKFSGSTVVVTGLSATIKAASS